jgi:multidrug efflux pump subunit AcrB
VAPTFIIKRPILALVLVGVAVILAGGVASLALAVLHYLTAPPPVVDVLASYPGANAQVVAEAVGTPIEQQVNGVEGMVAMSPHCGDDGSYRLTITFRRGTDPDMAQVLVQNRVSLARPMLPEVVKRGDIRVLKQPTR